MDTTRETSRVGGLDPSSIRVISFDCYGTLIDWEDGIVRACAGLLAGVGRGDLLRAFAAHEARHEAGAYMAYRQVLARTLDGMARELGCYVPAGKMWALADSLPGWKAFDETAGVLRRLATRWKIAVISNVDDDLFAATVGKLGVEPDWVITAQQCGSYKPSARNFAVALEKFASAGIGRDEVLHVAESLRHDIAPANALGLKSVWVDRARGGESASGKPGEVKGGSGEMPRATARVESLEELARLLGV